MAKILVTGSERLIGKAPQGFLDNPDELEKHYQYEPRTYIALRNYY